MLNISCGLTLILNAVSNRCKFTATTDIEDGSRRQSVGAVRRSVSDKVSTVTSVSAARRGGAES